MAQIQLTIDLEFEGDIDADTVAYKARDPKRWENMGAWSIRCRSVVVPDDLDAAFAEAIHASEQV